MTPTPKAWCANRTSSGEAGKQGSGEVGKRGKKKKKLKLAGVC